MYSEYVLRYGVVVREYTCRCRCVGTDLCLYLLYVLYVVDHVTICETKTNCLLLSIQRPI